MTTMLYLKRPRSGSGLLQFTEKLEGRKDGFGEDLLKLRRKLLAPSSLQGVAVVRFSGLF